MIAATPAYAMPLIRSSVVARVKSRWSASLKGASPIVVVSGAEVFVTSFIGPTGVTALSLSTGKVLWHEPSAGYALVATREVITYAHGDHNDNLLVALNPKTGALVWQKTICEGHPYALQVMGGRILSAVGTSLDAYDEITGKHLWHQSVDGLRDVQHLTSNLFAATAFPLDAEPHSQTFTVRDLRDGSVRWNSDGAIMYVRNGFAYVQGGQIGIPDDYEAAVLSKVFLDTGRIAANLTYRPAPALYQANGGYWMLQDRAFVTYPYVNVSLDSVVYRYRLDVEPANQNPVAAKVGNILGVTSVNHILTDLSGVSDVDFQTERPVAERLISNPASARGTTLRAISAGSFQFLLLANRAAYAYLDSNPSAVWKLADACDDFSAAQSSISGDGVLACGNETTHQTDVRLFRFPRR